MAILLIPQENNIFITVPYYPTTNSNFIVDTDKRVLFDDTDRRSTVLYTYKHKYTQKTPSSN